MEKKNVNVLKIVLSIVFAVAIVGAMVYRLLKGEPWDKPYLYFGSIAASLLLCVLFLKTSAKGIFIALALLAIVASEYFLIFQPVANFKDISLYVLCGSQFFFLLYTFAITSSNGLRAINLGLRAGVCLAICLVLPRYFSLDTYQLVYLSLFANAFITFVCLLFALKREWLMMLGTLLVTLTIAFLGLNDGLADAFGLTGGFVDFLANYEYLVGYFYVLGILLVSLTSVWKVKKQD